MLEKAKNRKIFYFFILVILGFSLFISPVFAANEPNYISDPLSPDGTSGGSFTACVVNVAMENVYRIEYEINKTNTPDAYLTANCGLKSGDMVSFGTVPNSYTSIGSGRITFDSDSFVIDEIDWPENYTSGNQLLIVKYGSRWWDCPALSMSYNVGVAPGSPYFGQTGIIFPNGITRTWADPYIPQSANITITPSSGASPLAVSFTDKSLGFTEGVDSVYLDYGNGESFSGLYGGYDTTRNYIYLDAGTYNYSYRLTNSGINYYSNGTVTVTGDSTVNFQVIVRGLNGAYIGNATVNIWYDSGTMKDSDITDDFYGSADFYVNPSRYVNGNVTKDGYYTSNFTYYVCPTGYCNNEVWITLYTTNETPGSGDEFGNYLVTFKDAVTGEEVGYSNIEVYSDSGYTTLFYDEYSNALGVWTGLLPMDIVLYYKYPETIGYYGQTWSYNLTSSPSYKTVNLVPKSGATATVTPTPTTIIPTYTPVVTYTLNEGNLSTLNVKERFTNLLVLAGFQNAESADLIFAMIIVLGCTALIGWITLSGSGAGMGAIIGFVFSLGLGLIPLWLLIAAIFFGCLYVALKLFGGSGE